MASHLASSPSLLLLSFVIISIGVSLEIISLWLKPFNSSHSQCQIASGKRQILRFQFEIEVNERNLLVEYICHVLLYFFSLWLSSLLVYVGVWVCVCACVCCRFVCFCHKIVWCSLRGFVTSKQVNHSPHSFRKLKIMQLSAGLQWIKNRRTDFNEVVSLHDIFNLQDCQCTQADESTLSAKNNESKKKS